MAKRDNDYYAQRLKRDHPQIWNDLQAGRYQSLAEARRAAGLGGQRTRLHELKNAWRSASDEQREEFLQFLDAQGVTLTPPKPSAGRTPTPTAVSSTSVTTTGLGFVVAQDGHLTPKARDRIIQIIDRRGLRGRSGTPRLGIIMKEFRPPFSPHDASLGMALAQGTRLRHDLVEALERWLAEHAGI